MFAWSILVLITMSVAYAQLSDSFPTPRQLEECKKLGIAPDQCSEAAILAAPRTSGSVQSPPPELGPVMLSIFVGSGAALVVGVLAVRKMRKGWAPE